MLIGLYWSLVALLLGGCIGSFLNVVVYRWSRGESIRHPSRSFCPSCQSPIAWYDNIPVISFLVLAGRCRHCRQTISFQYPAVELATALVFLILWDAFFAAQLREGITGLRADWPILLGHWVLFAGLIAMSAMDLEAYMIDIRITWWITLAAVLAHAGWTPATSVPMTAPAEWGPPILLQAGWIRPGPAVVLVTGAMAIGLGLAWLLVGRRWTLQSPENEDQLQDAAEEPTTGEQTAPPRRWGGWLIVILLTLLSAGYVATIATAAGQDRIPAAEPDNSATTPDATAISASVRLRAAPRILTVAIIGFVLLAIAASAPDPQVHQEVCDAIEEESAGARRDALSELALLSGAIVLGVAATIVAVGAWGTPATAAVKAALHWAPFGGTGTWPHWQPLWGVGTALTGWVIGGAIGWACRIFFTLVFGKEALGMGDVHMLAAAGAVAGWPVALLGFFLAAPLGLLAVMVIAFRPGSRVLPYGPWLASGFLLAALFQDVILRYLHVRWLFE